MARFYCPGCWKDFAEDVAQCPRCGLDIPGFWNAKDLVEKLIRALHHPEPSTPIRAAWMLGRIGDTRAVSALIDMVRGTGDVYITRAGVRALGKIGSPQARVFLITLLDHPATMIRDEVRTFLFPKTDSLTSRE